ncbi:hypothetical protein GGQ87_000622 [Brevundimonas alba]|uniref:DUF6894 domain-containing protein n=1 Tax=Brevundimonas alba TaxID=74314 RepID=A0A7X5YIN7_9CAUL|nr:hypothetical protein [Brevundimonas alba]NJC40364.1 hypothetical protein [Brevundimonas alba]
MPRFFFDISSDRAIRDDEGEDLADTETARDVAIRIAAELLPVHTRQLAQTGRVAIIVRDENGEIIHELECRLTTRSPGAGRH